MYIKELDKLVQFYVKIWNHFREIGKQNKLWWDFFLTHTVQGAVKNYPTPENAI